MMQGRFAVLSSKYDIISVLNYISMPYIALRSQGRWVSYNINHRYMKIKAYFSWRDLN